MAGGSGRPAGVGLLERGGELAHIEQAIAALKGGHGGVLVIEGAAGIGKSTLLRAVRKQAAGHGVPTLTARGSELEAELGFGVVRQLLETRVVRANETERAALLDGAARLAAPVLGLGNDSVGDPFAALHGLYWLVANLTITGPVVLACDDLQWADEPSLRWLVYFCHRLEGLPVLVAATTRPPRPGSSPLLAELLALGQAQILCPGPLSETAVAQLISQGLASEPDAMFVSACARATGGNPFMLHELIVDLAAQGTEPVAARAASVAEQVPDQVQRSVLARLRRLNPQARHLAQAIAVLGEDTELRLAAELIAEDRPLRFVHPLVRSAIYEQLASAPRPMPAPPSC